MQLDPRSSSSSSTCRLDGSTPCWRIDQRPVAGETQFGAEPVGSAPYDRAMTSPTWTVQRGETLVREQIHGVYGGNPQAGISRSSSTPNVLVYSDHEKAAANGYDFDGWNESQQVYYYTGEGKTGDQVMLRGNRAICRTPGRRHGVAVVRRGGQPARLRHSNPPVCRPIRSRPRTSLRRSHGTWLPAVARGRVWTTARVCRGKCPHLHAPRFEESCPDRSLPARWRHGLVAVGLGRAFERIGGGLCRLSRIGGSVRCQVVGGGFAGGR